MTLPLNNALFSITEFDTNVLVPQIHLVAQVQTKAQYVGVITNADGTKKSFTLSVVVAPAAQMVLIDVAATWTTDPVFTVAENGYLSVGCLSGNGGQTIEISNDTGVLLDNTALRAGQIVTLTLLRPGTHLLVDTTGGATCTVTVSYPTTQLPTGTVPVTLAPVSAGQKPTMMTPATVTVVPPQPIVVTVLGGTRLTTTLQATTDRVNGELVTKAVVQTP
jgi:hypothetical protein